MNRRVLSGAGLAAALTLSSASIWAGGCSTAPSTAAKRESLDAESLATIQRFKAAAPSMMKEFFDDARGYAVFPTVGKGAIGVGGAYGRGEVFDHDGTMIGFCDLSQGSIGLQLGGQAYSEIIFFEHDTALATFKSGKLAFAAQASAVAATAGASADAAYENGVAVFTLAHGGLMFEASIGGQKFRYEPRPAPAPLR